MKRWPPFGTSDGTEWTNGNPATGERGSVIDARAIDHSQAEIVNAITRLGLTPDEADLEQLGKAIQNAIAAATGGGDTGDFLTMATARARLPIYPEITNAVGKITVTEPSSGTILVGTTDTLRHRGVYDVAFSDIAEVDRTFAMLPSKVAHLRWSSAGGLERFYLDDAAYNPSGLPETDESFDSSYDSALLARIVTDASAAATITPLVNKAEIQIALDTSELFNRTPNNAFIAPFAPQVWDLSRTPKVGVTTQLISYPASILPRAFTGCATYLSGTRSDTTGSATASLDRYQMSLVGEVETGMVFGTAGVDVWGFRFQYTGLAVA